MLTITLLALALSLGNAGCPADSLTAARASQPSVAISEPAPVTTLTGFVELYWNEPAHLLSGGREIPLAGATNLVVPHGGLQVTLSGRFLSGGTFLVETVSGSSGHHAQSPGLKTAL